MGYIATKAPIKMPVLVYWMGVAAIAFSFPEYWLAVLGGGLVGFSFLANVIHREISLQDLKREFGELDESVRRLRESG